MPKHSANEQYLLELINAERAKTGAQPLAFDNDLSEAAEGHSKWMLAADVFSHTGSGGSSSTQRMKAAGYVLQGSWATGENIAWATTRRTSREISPSPRKCSVSRTAASFFCRKCMVRR